VRPQGPGLPERVMERQTTAPARSRPAAHRPIGARSRARRPTRDGTPRPPGGHWAWSAPAGVAAGGAAARGRPWACSPQRGRRSRRRTRREPPRAPATARRWRRPT